MTEQEVTVVDTTQPVETDPKKQPADMTPVETQPVKDPTKVRTIQQMAVEQGQQIPSQMSPEQLRTQLLLDHHLGMSAVIPAFKSLSQRGKDRIFIAMMQLPHEGLETALNGNFEKQIYLAAQKALMAKHAIMFNRAKQEKMVEMAAEAQKQKLKAEKAEAEKKAAESGEKTVETDPKIDDTKKVEDTSTDEKRS